VYNSLNPLSIDEPVMPTEKQLEPKESDVLLNTPDQEQLDLDDLEPPKKSFIGRWGWRIAMILIFCAVAGGGYYAYTQLTAPANNQSTRKRDRLIS
jgi:HlyD family secretion protein